MNAITSPLKPPMRGPRVRFLQDALLALLDRAAILAGDENERRRLAASLRPEQAQLSFGDTTKMLVGIFQRERRFRVTGEVDRLTAEALNNLLRELGLLEQEGQPMPRTVTGTVQQEGGPSMAGARVRASHVGEGEELDLGEDLTDVNGRYTIRYSAPTEVSDINLRVSVIGSDGGTFASSEVVEDAGPRMTINLTVPASVATDGQQTIQGTIVLEHGLPAVNLAVRLYRRGFGGVATLLCETSTLADGRFVFSYDGASPSEILEIRAVKDDGEVPLTRPLNDLPAETRASLNLLAAGSLQPVTAEYRRLAADLKAHVGEMSKLKDAREDAQQQDFAVLHRATGWDARLIALASMSERLAADPDVELSSEVLYGLLRAGLPSDKLLLAQVEPDAVEMAIEKVRDAGVVELDDAGIEEVKAKFTDFAETTRLAMPAPGSRSTYGQLLTSSGLSQEAQDKFAKIYLAHRGSGAQLWEEAREAGLKGTDIARLQLQGKLALLAGNSERVTKGLLDRGLEDPVDLVDEGFYSAAKWEQAVLDIANRNENSTLTPAEKLEAAIPVAYPGKKVEARLKAYAQDMARKIRLSYPTQVLGHLVENDEKFKLPAGHDVTVKLLKDAIAQGFRMGETPVSVFLPSRKGLEHGLTDSEFGTAADNLRMLQRLYQITPCNEAMPVLQKMGIKSAFDVMAYPQEQFASRFRTKYFHTFQEPAPTGVAELVFSKAQQVSCVTHNLFAIARTLDSNVSVMAISGTPEQHAEAKGELKKALKDYPTLETLFGSLDYCECEHCRSVLSPAAYFVDLLQFVDPEPQEWRNFLAEWEARRKTEYQEAWNTNPNGSRRGPDERKPYDALIERRPDLPYISLTCENTHTALPYIDIVNEILEYYVAHDKLAAGAAHDTGDATSAELLAEPQNVIRDAYDALRNARYPLKLPFDVWLETVRSFCDYFETPLHRILEVLRPEEGLIAPIAKATNDGHATVTVANAVAKKFENEMDCTYFAAGRDVSPGETNRISAIGAEDSGGAGQTTITFQDTWDLPPSAGDRLVHRPLEGWARIFIESLGLSPAEVDIFTDPDPLTNWHGLYGYDDDTADEAITSLISAKTLSRRLGVAYKEIVDIVQTGFVNPDLVRLRVLYRLGVSVRDAWLYKTELGFCGTNRPFYEKNSGKGRNELSPEDQATFDELAKNRPGRGITGWDVLHESAAFEQRLSGLAREFVPPLDVNELRKEILAIPFDRVLVLADPDAGCNFDQTTLLYADGSKASAIAFLRINLFVRLWRRLGWSIEETDRALTAFIPKSAPYDEVSENLKQQPLKTALVYIAHLNALHGKLKIGREGRLKLLTLWSDIATTGKKPLYAQLFLNRSVLKSSPVFDDPLGEYLTDTNISMKVHVLALQGALGLTADDIQRILADVNTSLDTAQLTIASVSLIYRYGLLAKALKLQVRDLISFKRISGLDPFMPISPHPLLSLDQDHPFCQTLEFINAVEEAKDSGLKIEDLVYLLEHRHDDTGKYRSNRQGTLALLKALSEGIRSISTELAVQDEPGAVTDEILRQKLGLALPPDVVGRFLGMLDNTAEFTATSAGVDAKDQLDPKVFASDDRIRYVSYKEVPRKEQTLTVLGVLSEAAKDQMKSSFADLLTPKQKEVFAALLDGVQQQARDFFNQHLRRQTGTQPENGFLDEGDFEFLFAPSPFDLEWLKPVLNALDAVPSSETNVPVPITEQFRARGISLSEDAKIAKTGENLWHLGDSGRDFTVAKLRDALYVEKEAVSFTVDLLAADQSTLTAYLEGVTGEAVVPDTIRSRFTAHGISLSDRARITKTAENLWSLADDGTTFALSRVGQLSARIEKSIPVARRFFPFLQARLIRQFIVQSLTAETGADPALVESLVTDARLLEVDGQALLVALGATAERGVTAAFFVSDDQSGQAQMAPAIIADADTNLKGEDNGGGNQLQAANSATFEGYLEVPIPGAYRFFIEIEKKGGAAQLSFEHLPDPRFLEGTSVDFVIGDRDPEDNDKFLVLEAGVPYRFTLGLKTLSGGRARLLVQGETLPRGPLSQLTLYPAAAIEAAERATVLLGKALRVVESLALSEREIRYLLTHAADFGGLNLSELPTVVAGDSLADKAASARRFGRFRRLAAYARLKRDLAGGTDDLISIFEANGTTAPDRLDTQVYPLIAKITRRDEATVKSCEEILVEPPAVPAFESENPLWRLWEALQVVERFGVLPSGLSGLAGIVTSGALGEERFNLARDLKEAIRARFEPEAWQRVAQPIFDTLRPRQRDALVSHVLQQMRKDPEKENIDTQEKLFEYFLIDPGMEPVVQTSRIRLAIASLQLFIQRCLLNMEPKVHPSTINARHWEWMKRYRVWEANRKIYLFPENWLEPEFRDDKTHLFAELEGALLQGDVSNDLVEDAFLNYLKKLDELARLNVCAMHIEDGPGVLHVFGRTFSQPHKYFYRRHANQMWTPWEPVSAEIEGDHLAPVVWRDRLYLFWVTFMDKADPNPSTGSATAGKTLEEASLSDVMTDLKAVVANKVVDVQLHWSEYLDGEWSTRESGGPSPSQVITAVVPKDFDPSDVFVHVSKECDPTDGTDLGVFVHLSGRPINQAFYLSGRNSTPEIRARSGRPHNPFNSANTVLANRYRGSGALKVSYGQQITIDPVTTPLNANPSILQMGHHSGGGYTIVPCNSDPGCVAEFPRLVLPSFGYEAGGWRVKKHPRLLADLTGDGRADIVGFGNAGVYVALNNGDGTFQRPKKVLEAFGCDVAAGGWDYEKHPRLLADLTGDGRADIVGFGDDGVWVALSKGDGTFKEPSLAVPNFGYEAGDWRVDKHPRLLADLTGDGRADIVGFGNYGVYVALNKGVNGPGKLEFGEVAKVIDGGLGYEAGGWRVKEHPRLLADLTGDGRADIVGFGNYGVQVALNNGDGTFQARYLAVPNFGYKTGGWHGDKHERFLADMTGDGAADIVGFGDDGVWLARSRSASESASHEIASLRRPVFYQDSRHAFFVEPEVTERTIEEWQEWVPSTPATEPGWKEPDWWTEIGVVQQVPRKQPAAAAADSWPSSIHGASLVKPSPDSDWLVNRGSAIKFKEVLIGPAGQPGLAIGIGRLRQASGRETDISSGGALGGGSNIVVVDETSYAGSGLGEIAGGLNVIGSAGYNPALRREFDGLRRSAIAAGALGVGGMKRRTGGTP